VRAGAPAPPLQPSILDTWRKYLGDSGLQPSSRQAGAGTGHMVDIAGVRVPARELALGLPVEQFAAVAKTLCGFPSFFAAPLFRRVRLQFDATWMRSKLASSGAPASGVVTDADVDTDGTVSLELFLQYWKVEMEPYDHCDRWVHHARLSWCFAACIVSAHGAAYVCARAQVFQSGESQGGECHRGEELHAASGGAASVSPRTRVSGGYSRVPGTIPRWLRLLSLSHVSLRMRCWGVVRHRAGEVRKDRHCENHVQLGPVQQRIRRAPLPAPLKRHSCVPCGGHGGGHQSGARVRALSWSDVPVIRLSFGIWQVNEYFSYEHFYVLYCKFWELDSDRDFMLTRQDLSRMDNLTHVVLDRVFSQAGRPFSTSRPDRMGYEDFICALPRTHGAAPRRVLSQQGRVSVTDRLSSV
jgi:hypothetical protein